MGMIRIVMQIFTPHPHMLVVSHKSFSFSPCLHFPLFPEVFRFPGREQILAHFCGQNASAPFNLHFVLHSFGSYFALADIGFFWGGGDLKGPQKPMGAQGPKGPERP